MATGSRRGGPAPHSTSGYHSWHRVGRGWPLHWHSAPSAQSTPSLSDHKHGHILVSGFVIR